MQMHSLMFFFYLMSVWWSVILDSERAAPNLEWNNSSSYNGSHLLLPQVVTVHHRQLSLQKLYFVLFLNLFIFYFPLFISCLDYDKIKHPVFTGAM